ncbi:MAG: carboxypeptidase regulatory-like domain-containing protein [Polyangiaceae bacterium]|nr:carboxypeptidase regulatory-like domain-containing protein [Polyangiaceae bacterium]
MLLTSASSLRFGGAAFLVAAAIVAARDARADAGDSCVAAYEGAQQARKDGALVRSKADLRLCMRACPTTLAADCERWLAEVDADLAPLTVTVKDESGRAPAHHTVFVDGLEQPKTSVIELAPGAHRIAVEAPGHARSEAMVVLERGRPATHVVTLHPARAAESPPPNLAGPLVVGGVGLGAVIAATAVAIVGHLDVADMRDEETGCAPSCPIERVDRVETLWTTGAVTGGVGGAALLAGAIWLGVELAGGAPPAEIGIVRGPGDVGIALEWKL